jgi:hypothetical protein
MSAILTAIGRGHKAVKGVKAGSQGKHARSGSAGRGAWRTTGAPAMDPGARAQGMGRLVRLRK